MASEFLFVLPPGTMGDQKPLAILAVYAAYAMFLIQSKIQITIVCFENMTWMKTIERFALQLIGKQFIQWLQIEHGELDEVRMKNAIVFTVQHTYNESYRDQQILLDFGDNASLNRFTSVLLSGYRSKSNSFGSLYLPIERNQIQWADELAKKELSTFRNKHKNQKCLVIAGSLRPPFELSAILHWIESNVTEDWVILLLGYNDIIHFGKFTTRMKQNKNKIHAMKHSIPYEDVVAVADFFVSNCGAGSVVTSLAAGCPQLCRHRGTVGIDKPFNQDIIGNQLKVGPFDPREQLSFGDLMNLLQTDYDFYLKHAIYYQAILQQELLQMQENLIRFFTDLRKKRFQQQLQKSNFIPKKYALKQL